MIVLFSVPLKNLLIFHKRNFFKRCKCVILRLVQLRPYAITAMIRSRQQNKVQLIRHLINSYFVFKRLKMIKI